LSWLFGHPDEAFYVRQILRETGAPQGATQRELNALTDAGILKRTRHGRQVYFQVDRGSPVFGELQSLLVKTAGAVGVIRDNLAPIAERIRAAFIFGSAARNELQRDSDIDLLVVGDVSFGEVVDALGTAQKTLGREINPVVYPPDEFSRKVQAGHHFLTAVQKTPMLFVAGERDDLERLGADQSVARSAPDNARGDRKPPRRRRPGPARQSRRRSER